MVHVKEWRKIIRKIPSIAVDGIIFEDDKVLLIERIHEPYKGHSVLPGGFVEFGERLEEAIVREVFEETGLRTKVIRFTGIYDDPKRDPRGHVITVPYILKRTGGKIRDSSETRNVRFWPLNKLPRNMAYDCRNIIKDALKLSKNNKQHKR
jgi:8-oxo-dGTP diphosphatase